jgi:uncharacterized protein YjbI with pentapeptide repeats
MYPIIEDQTFTSQEYLEKWSESHFFNCTFEHCQFKKTNWQNVQFRECVFKNCLIDQTLMDQCRLQQVTFEKCKLVGINFFKCTPTFFSIAFKNCLLHYCNFSDLKMPNSNFMYSKFYECHFNNTYLEKCDFSHTDLKNTIFHNCLLNKANFISAIHYSINPQTNKMKQATFSFPEAIELLRAMDIIVK